MLGVGELVVRVAVQDKGLPRSLAYGSHAVAHLADLPQLRAGNDGTGLIYNTDNTVHSVLHLIYYVLEHTVCHNQQLLFWYIVGSGKHFGQFALCESARKPNQSNVYFTQFA